MLIYQFDLEQKKPRKRTSKYQLGILEKVYNDEDKPNRLHRDRIAEVVGSEWTQRDVQVWFQNRCVFVADVCVFWVSDVLAQESEGEEAAGKGEVEGGLGDHIAPCLQGPWIRLQRAAVTCS